MWTNKTALKYERKCKHKIQISNEIMVKIYTVFLEMNQKTSRYIFTLHCITARIPPKLN